MRDHKRFLRLVGHSLLEGFSCGSLGGAFDFATEWGVLAVLQGTDWIKPDAQVGIGIGSVAPYGGNDEPLLTAFPFLADPQPLPGDPETVGFPAQQ